MPESPKGGPVPLAPSRYNVIFEGSAGTRLAFSGSTAALAEVDPQTWPAVAGILADPDSPLDPEREALKRKLIEGRYLVPAGEDEAERLREKALLHRSSNPVLLLTVAPTLACNFDCGYCFQRHVAGRMTRPTEEALLSFCERRMGGSEGLLVTWFGGEPTLCVETIERLQAALLDLCGRRGAKLEPSSIVTNGFLLDAAMASRLAAAGVAAAQVTLDGPEPVHDGRRMLRGGGPTFRTILRNLGASAGILAITIRVNVDRNNFGAASEVVGALEREGLLERVRIFFAPVNPSEGACVDMMGRCTTTGEFARGQLRLYEELVGAGFRQIDYPDLASGGVCGADTDNGFVVGPNGLIFKCWEDLSLRGEMSVGTIFSEEREPFQRQNLDRYRSWDAFGKPGCAACDILPICMGGCPRQGLSLGPSARGACSPWKYNLVEMLRLRHVCETGKEVSA